jgi:transcriptional regulator with XRE-family HTH domain
MRELAQTIKALRKRKALSIKDLSSKTGLSTSIISRLEAGRVVDPRLSVLSKLSHGLGVSISHLLPDGLTPSDTPTAHLSEDVPSIIGQSDPIRAAVKQLHLVAANSSSVLLTGETGTGKSLFAKNIHLLSNRRTGPFITINCGALPEPLIESELFGTVRGAFTGADTRRGAFEQASGGTIYLDEIGTMPFHLQPTILRVLEAAFVRPLGSAQERKIDCRIIASTNIDIDTALASGKFRLDLFYRFTQQIHLPPLRNRPRDIPLLVDFFLSYDAHRLAIQPKRIEEEAMELLLQYHWPGNIRQLESVLDSLMISVEGDDISRHHLEEVFGRDGIQQAARTVTLDLFRSQKIPYYFGPAVSDPSRFFGRHAELGTILRLLRQSDDGEFFHIAVIGDHRTGKSSLLRILDAKVPSETKSLSTYLDLASIGEDEFFETLIKRVAKLVYAQSSDGRLVRGAKEIADTKIWKSLLGEVDVDIMGFLKLKSKPSSGKHWSEFSEILAALRRRLNDFGSYSSIVLILDEVSACAAWRGSSDLLKNWRSQIQSLSGYNFIVADAHPLYQISKDRWSAFFNVFTPLPLGGLDPSEAEQLITMPAKEVGVEYAPEALARIRDLSANKPYYIQLICSCIFEWLLKSRTTAYVSRRLVDLSIDPALERLSEYFSSLWSTLMDFQKHYLLELARGQEPKFSPITASKDYESEKNQVRLLRERQIVAKDRYNAIHLEPLLKIWIDRYFLQ